MNANTIACDPLLVTTGGPFERLRARTPRGRFWLFFSAGLLFTIGFSIYFLLFNLYLLDQGFNERFIGVIGSLMAAGGILGTIPAGMLASRFGLRNTLTVGLLSAALFSALRAYVVWQPAQIVFALLGGSALCSWAVCLSPAVASMTSERERPLGFSLMFASGIGMAGIGGLLGGRLTGLVQRLPFSVRASPYYAKRDALLVACVIASLAVVPILFLRRSDEAVNVLSRRIAFPRWSDTFLRRFLPAMAVWGLVTGAFPPFANVYFVRHLGISLEKMGSLFSVSQLVQFIAVLCAPLLFRRIGLTAGIMLTQFATAVALAALAVFHLPAAASLIYWAYMALQSMNEPGLYSLLMQRIPVAEHNGASASMFFVSSLSQAIASTLVGAGVFRFGYPAVLGCIATLAVLAAFLFRRLSSSPASL